MTPKEFVEKYLQNCEYRFELSKEAETVAKENRLVVVYGVSDDLCEFQGAIDEEFDCYDGGTITPCDYPSISIETVWNDDNGYSWSYKTDIPHEEFDILEDNDKYCRGIVFCLDDVPKPVPRYIDANKLKENALWVIKDFEEFKAVSVNMIDAAPIADVVPVVHGFWEKVAPNLCSICVKGETAWQCSVCKHKYVTNWDGDVGFDYCPDCGAKMDGKEIPDEENL